MAQNATLGEAVVAIRATMEHLGKDLNTAKSKVSNVMGGITKTLGNIGLAGFGAFGAAATGAIGAIAGVGMALGGMAKQAAEVEGLQGAFNSLAGQAGTTGDAMLAALQKGSGGTVAARDLMTSFNKAASLVSLQFATELPDAMELVSKAAAATGQDMGFLMDSLVTGVGRVSPMILDNLGIQVSLSDAVERYAEQTGKAATELTKQEQQEAVRLLTMEKLKEKYGEMESVYDTSAAKMQQMRAAFQDAKDQMGMAFMPVLTTVMGALTELANTLLPVLLPLVEGFANSILVVFDALSPLLPIITTFAEKLAIVFDSFMGGDIETAMAVFGAALSELTANLSEVLPGLIMFGMDILFAIIEGVIAAIPNLLQAGFEIIMSLVDTLVTLLPRIMVLGIDILLALVEGIANMLPTLIPTALQIVITLITALIDKLPDIITAGIDLLLALVEGILAALPDLVAAIPEIIIAFTTAIIGALPEIIVVGIDIIVALVEGLIQAIPQLVAAIPEIIKAIVSAFGDAYTEFQDVGSHIVEGVKTGISNAWGALKEWFNGLIDGLVGGVKGLLGIDSPSKVFKEIGSNLTKGLAIGIHATMDEPIAEMDKMAAGLIPEFGSGGGTQITNNNYINANYKYQDELTLTEHIRIMSLLGSVA